LFAVAAGVAVAMGLCSFLVTSSPRDSTPSSESSTSTRHR
jgi:hypothetical protein